MRLKQTEEKIEAYLKEMDKNDMADSDEDKSVNVDELKAKICKLEEEKQRYEQIQDQMKATGQKEISLVDSDSRLMRVDNQKLEVCYNVQTSVDAKQHLIVDYDVVNISTDHHQLVKDALAAKETLGMERLDVLSDKGFYVEKDVFDCEANDIRVFMPIPAVFNPYKSVGVPEPEFYSDRFVYNAAKDVYVCPAGNVMSFWKRSNCGKGFEGRLYRSTCCASCSVRGKCTRNKRGRYMFRGEFDGAVDRLRDRLATSEGKVNCRLRRMLAEHPFGTMKRAFNQGYLLLKGLRKVKGEVGFTMLAYNMRRAINIVGVGTLIALVKA